MNPKLAKASRSSKLSKSGRPDESMPVKKVSEES